MKLLLDAGNSRIKWACWEAGRIFGAGAAAYGDAPDAAIARALDAPEAVPGAVLAANVAGARIGDLLSTAVRTRWSTDVQYARTERAAGELVNGYDDPSQMGVDRWLAMVAAWGAGGAPVCVVDAGTAVTCDLIEADGAHLGGYIVPGLDLMSESLRRGTGNIAQFAGRREEAASGAPEPARDTNGAIRAGALMAVAGLIDRSLCQFSSPAGSPRLILTGGHAERVRATIGGSVEHRPLLVLEGLAARLA